MGTTLDVIFVLLTGILVVVGVRRGFVRSLMEFIGGIAVLIATALLSGFFADFLCTVLKDVVKDDAAVVVLRACSTLILFIALQILVRVVAKALDAVFNLPVLHGLNCVLGGAFGFLKGAIVVLLLCAVLDISGEHIDINGTPISESLPDSWVYTDIYLPNPIESMFRLDE